MTEATEPKALRLTPEQEWFDIQAKVRQAYERELMASAISRWSTPPFWLFSEKFNGRLSAPVNDPGRAGGRRLLEQKSMYKIKRGLGSELIYLCAIASRIKQPIFESDGLVLCDYNVIGVSRVLEPALAQKLILEDGEQYKLSEFGHLIGAAVWKSGFHGYVKDLPEGLAYAILLDRADFYANWNRFPGVDASEPSIGARIYHRFQAGLNFRPQAEAT